MKQIDAEPIIKNLSLMKTQLDYDAIDIDGMIKALREAEEIKAEFMLPNGPMTLEELLEMNGEPVWIELIVGTVGQKNGWAICYFDSVSAAATQRWANRVLWYEDYGKTWLAYCRKPSE